MLFHLVDVIILSQNVERPTSYGIHTIVKTKDLIHSGLRRDFSYPISEVKDLKK